MTVIEAIGNRETSLIDKVNAACFVSLRVIA